MDSSVVDMNQVPRGIPVEIEILADSSGAARTSNGYEMVDVSFGGIGTSMDLAAIQYTDGPMWSWVREDYDGGKKPALVKGYAVRSNERGTLITCSLGPYWQGREHEGFFDLEQIHWPEGCNVSKAMLWLRAEECQRRGMDLLAQANAALSQARAWYALSGLDVEYDEAAPYEKDYNHKTGEVRSHLGTEAGEVARIVSLLAAKHGRRVQQADFNGHPIYADPGDDRHTVYRRWHDAMGFKDDDR